MSEVGSNEYFAEHQKERYHYLTSRGLCGKCGKQDAYTMNGRHRCFECNQKLKGYKKKYYEANKQKILDKKKTYVDKRKALGQCVNCNNKAAEGHNICGICLSKMHKYNESRRGESRRLRTDCELCYVCGEKLDGQKNQDGSQSRLCSACYERTCNNMHKAINQSIKNREERKPIMNTQEIIEGYTNAATKSNYVNKTAKKLKKPKSWVICELFKSGYKYLELQRMMPNDYKAAENKYQKWLEEGGQAEPLRPDQEEQTEEIQDNELEVAKKAIDSLEADKTELKSKLAETENNLLIAHGRIQIESQKHKEEMKKSEEVNFGLLTENEKLEEQILQNAERIRTLESENEELKEKYTSNIAPNEKYAERISELESDIEQLKKERDREENNHNRSYTEVQEELEKLRKENEELSGFRDQYYVLLETSESAIENQRQEIEMLKIKLSAENGEGLDELEEMDEEINSAKAEIERLNEDLSTLTKMYMKESKKRKKLEKVILKLVVK